MGLTGLLWWIDRWRKSSAYMDMTLEEQGAYRNLLDEATLRGGPLPIDERILAKACGDALRWSAVRSAVMARFERRADGWHNVTLDSILAKTSMIHDVRSESGRRGGLAKLANHLANGVANTVANEVANDLAKAVAPDPDPDPDPEFGSGSSTSRKPRSESFDAFWAAYPHKKGKNAARKSWWKLRPDSALVSAIMAAVQSQRGWPEWRKDGGAFIPHPATWLNQERWLDERPAVASVRVLTAEDDAAFMKAELVRKVVSW